MMKPLFTALLSLTLLTGPALAQEAQPETRTGWSVRGSLGYLKGRGVPVGDLELELAYRFAAWQGRFELGLLYGAYAPFSLPELRDIGGPFGLSTLHGLQVRGRFYLLDQGTFALDPYVSIQAGATTWADRPNWILPSFGLGLDWYFLPRLALSAGLTVPFWSNQTLSVQMQPELGLKWRF